MSCLPLLPENGASLIHLTHISLSDLAPREAFETGNEVLAAQSALGSEDEDEDDVRGRDADDAFRLRRPLRLRPWCVLNEADVDELDHRGRVVNVWRPEVRPRTRLLRGCCPRWCLPRQVLVSDYWFLPSVLEEPNMLRKVADFAASPLTFHGWGWCSHGFAVFNNTVGMYKLNHRSLNEPSLPIYLMTARGSSIEEEMHLKICHSGERTSGIDPSAFLFLSLTHSEVCGRSG